MSKAKWLILFVLALAIAVPSYAVEVSLGGFPSYMRTRIQFIDNGTFINAMTDDEARALGLENANDELTIVDTTLRLTPQLVLSDAVTIRAQVDVFHNILWGGLTSAPFGADGGSGAVTGELTADDALRGSILLGPQAVDTGDDNQNFFRVRMLHADIVLPNNLGFIRVGRQPFDWGMGIWANGGWDPHSDLGFLPERFLWLKSWPMGSATFTQVLVSDLVSSGNSFVNGSGKTFDIVAGASILSGPVGSMTGTIGFFYFPFVQQDNIGNASAVGEPSGTTIGVIDADRIGLYSGWLQLKGEKWKFDYEVDAQEGTLKQSTGPEFDIDVDWQFEMAGRLEYYPGHPVQVVAIEGGWSQGQDNNDLDVNGNFVPMHPSYNIDNLLFKHIIPTIYNLEGSVQNAYYGRIWTNIKFLDHWSFMPHVLAAWNDETDTCIGNPTASGFAAGSLLCGGDFATNAVNDIDDFLGVEVEGTLTWNMYPGVDIDLIGSIIFAGDGLTDLLNAQAALNGAENPDASDTPWAVQGRMLIYIDEFFKTGE